MMNVSLSQERGDIVITHTDEPENQASGRMIMKCIMCGVDSPDVREVRQRTSYINDKDNFIIVCPKCEEENDEYWRGMWAEYYQGCL